MKIEPRKVLELHQVVKHYPGSPPIKALDGVDLVIRAGELVVVVGPSGSGKSTMLNIMGALDRPSSGEVVVDGQRLSDLADREVAGVRGHRIGFVFQQFHLLEGLTALDNVATGNLYQGLSLRWRRQMAREVLERVGLGHRMTQRPGKLSGGERQRVAIARALLGDPAIVLADEPTGNLDSQNTEEIVELFLELNHAGSTIVIITHDRELADRMPRSVAILDGRISHDSAADPLNPDADRDHSAEA